MYVGLESRCHALNIESLRFFKQMVLRSSRRLAFILASALQLTLFFNEQPSKAASALAAWNVDSKGVLKLRTSKGARLKAFFQYADSDKGDRIWIDFPGELIRPRKIPGNGPINEIRLGKPKEGFTRLVIEFNPSISIDPNKLKLVGTSLDRWEMNFEGIPTNGLTAFGEGNLIKPPKRPVLVTLNKSSKSQLDYSDLPKVPQGRFLVVIDPGHGGPDSGAVGIRGIRETDVVLDISLQVAEILNEKGVRVTMTRAIEIDLDLPPRVALANRLKADVFVSIHANASRGARRDVNGIETFYYSGSRGFRLASLLQKEILNVSPGSPDRGVRRSRFFVIRRTNMPAALVETGFVTGRLDSSRLAQTTHRKNLAFAISKGVLLYLKGER